MYPHLVSSVLFLWVLRSPSLWTAGVAILSYVAFTLFNNRYNNGLLHFPGPAFASMTNIWRVHDAYVNGNKRPSYVALHNKYGDVVRLGPKSLSFASPAAIADIYPAERNMAKVSLSKFSSILASRHG